MLRQVIGACSISLALTVAASAQTPMGAEFRVNTYTTGHQRAARAAMEPDGDFVVVWESDGQDGYGYGAFGQRFAASGAPRGSEFRINTYTIGRQGRPRIAVGSGGDFVVVWASVQDGSSQSIQGRRYDSAGNPIGGEFLVNTFTTGYQSWPQVGRASDGRFVVSWVSENDGSSRGIAARRFDALGSPIGVEFVVNPFTTGDQLLADVAVQANGDMIVVWEDRTVRDTSGSAVWGKRFNAAGDPMAPEFLVNTYWMGNQRFPSVSVSPAGGFVVAWTSQFGDGSGYGMFARRFDASGNGVGSDFLVNTFTTGSQRGVGGQVAHDVAGNFVIAWHGGGVGDVYGTFAQRFSASGARRGAEFKVSTYFTDAQMYPSVASDSVGNFVVTWQSGGQDGSGYGIFAQRYGDLIFEDGFDPTNP